MVVFGRLVLLLVCDVGSCVVVRVVVDGVVAGAVVVARNAL